MPVAPPNPYKVAGKVVQGGVARVFLVSGDRVYEAKEGDELDGGYRVAVIASDRIELLYVPLGTKETMPVVSLIGGETQATAPVPAAAPAAAGGSPAPAPGTPSAAPDPSKPAQLRWEGPERVRAGASFSVALRVSSGESLRATPMQLRYEPDVLEALGVRAGKFFGQGNFSYRIGDGSIFVGASASGAAPGTDAELLVVTFRPIKAGAMAEVKVSALTLQGNGGRTIVHAATPAFRTAIQ